MASQDPQPTTNALRNQSISLTTLNIETRCTFERSSSPDIQLGQAPLLLFLQNDSKAKGSWGGTFISDLSYDTALDEWKGTFWGNQFRYKNMKVNVLNSRTNVSLYYKCEPAPAVASQEPQPATSALRNQSINLTTLNIDLRPTGNDEVDKLKSLLITPTTGDVFLSAFALDRNWQQTNEIEGNPVAFVTNADSRRVNQIITRLLSSLQIDASKWIVRIVDTNPKIENAFVTGSRIIYVYTGLIANTKSEDELAFVLGHEIGHTLLKHVGRHDNPTADFLATLAKIGSQLGTTDAGKEAFGFVGDTLTSYFSREHEREADAMGAYIAIKAGYRFTDASNFFKRMILLQNQSDAESQAMKSKIVAESTRLVNHCVQQRQLFNSGPLYRTQRNATIVNQACQQATDYAGQVSAKLKEIAKSDLKGMFTRSHPVDDERVRSVVQISRYVNCQGTESDLASIGQGYYVLKAVDFSPQCR